MNFRLPAKLRVKLSKVFWITLLWTLFGVLEVLYIHVLSFDFPSFQAQPNYSFHDLFFANLIAVSLGGLITGFILVFMLRGRFRDSSFSMSVFLNTLIVLLILLVLISLGMGIFNSYQLKINFFSQQNFDRAMSSFQSYFFLSKIILWLVIIFMTNLLLDVSTGIAERIGHIKFFELLHDFFQDITDPILFSRGSIYQYIGDGLQGGHSLW